MNIALIMSAVKHGAVVANYCEVTQLHKHSSSGKLKGARIKDNLTGEEWNVRAKVNKKKNSQVLPYFPPFFF
jgi:glycerol-3-phosphate dehydrogenase